MVLHVVQQVQKLVVVGTVAGLAGEFVHFGRPAGGLDPRDAHGVDGADDAVAPLLGGLVHDMRFGDGTDLRVDGLFHLEQHAAAFEVADARDHGALHDRATFVVFDVTHPDGAVEGDFFREALLFEVTDGIVVRVG